VRHVGTFLLGAVVALACLAVHRRAAGAGQLVPWGAALAVAASWSAGWWLRASRRPRLATSYAVGWLAVFSGALVGRPEGDYVVAADLRGYALMAAAVGVLVVAVAGLAARSEP
jgi:hypothetical protein